MIFRYFIFTEVKPAEMVNEANQKVENVSIESKEATTNPQIAGNPAVAEETDDATSTCTCDRVGNSETSETMEGKVPNYC